MNIYCDDGSTNVKLAWFGGDELQTRVSANSFRHGWKVAVRQRSIIRWAR